MNNIAEEKKPLPNEGEKRLPLRVPGTVKQALEAMADTERRSVNQQAVVILEAAVKPYMKTASA